MKGEKYLFSLLSLYILNMKTDKFIFKSQVTHNNKYDYSQVEYKNTDTKVCIICPIHGEFWQTPHNHLKGQGCPKCVNKNVTTEEFIQKAQQIHGNKYDYSQVKYINAKTKVCIICPIHGEFWQTPNKHLRGQNCPKCKGINKTTYDLINTLTEMYGDKYDYSKVQYINAKSKIIVICKKHGEFLITPNNHLNGKECPKCHTSKLENEISSLLNENHIEYKQNGFYDFLNGLQLDFYLPKYNIAIECQGMQHFRPANFRGLMTEKEVDDNFIKQIKRDQIKKQLCEENNIKLLYYSNLSIKYPYKVYENKEELLKEII